MSDMKAVSIGSGGAGAQQAGAKGAGNAGRIAALLVPLGVCWLVCWLLPGLILGDLTVVLRGEAPRVWSLAYIVGLYFSVLACTWRAWRQCGPDLPVIGGELRKPGAGGQAVSLWKSCVFIVADRQTALWLLWGWLGTLGHRTCLWLSGSWTPLAVEWGTYLLLALSNTAMALVLSLAEELLFRGYIFGGLHEKGIARWGAWGARGAYVAASCIFASLHILRPGGWRFKVFYACGLFLLSLILCLLVTTTGKLSACVGLHAGLISVCLGTPLGRIEPSWWAGLQGEACAGAGGLALLLLILAVVWLYGQDRQKQVN